MPRSSDDPPPHRASSVRIRHLNDPPDDDLSDVLGPALRIELVWTLSQRMWEITGQPFPVYDRASTPVHIVRRG